MSASQWPLINNHLLSCIFAWQRPSWSTSIKFYHPVLITIDDFFPPSFDQARALAVGLYNWSTSIATIITCCSRNSSGFVRTALTTPLRDDLLIGANSVSDHSGLKVVGKDQTILWITSLTHCTLFLLLGNANKEISSLWGIVKRITCYFIREM